MSETPPANSEDWLSGAAVVGLSPKVCSGVTYVKGGRRNRMGMSTVVEKSMLRSEKTLAQDLTPTLALFLIIKHQGKGRAPHGRTSLRPPYIRMLKNDM